MFGILTRDCLIRPRSIHQMGELIQDSSMLFQHGREIILPGDIRPCGIGMILMLIAPNLKT